MAPCLNSSPWEPFLPSYLVRESLVLGLRSHTEADRTGSLHWCPRLCDEVSLCSVALYSLLSTECANVHFCQLQEAQLCQENTPNM